MIHDFDDCKERGEDGEARLDRFFESQFGYEINLASDAEQRQGIDRWFVSPNGTRQSVQYKRDAKAYHTKHAFIETVSVGIPPNIQHGWAYTCAAKYIVYYIPQSGVAYLLEPPVVRKYIDAWMEEYNIRAARNREYWTYGVCVPLTIIEQVAMMLFQIETEEVASGQEVLHL